VASSSRKTSIDVAVFICIPDCVFIPGCVGPTGIRVGEEKFAK
jgi:hypothetical protein